MSAENDVREASKQNAAAMNLMVKGDASKLAAVWSQRANVSAMQPIGGRDIGGWDVIKGAAESFAGAASDGAYELRDQHIAVVGDMAYEMGVEHVEGKFAGHPYILEGRVTNIYQREADGWKVIHHHADISPALVELISKLQAQ